MFGLHWIDIVALGMYFIGITVIGVWSARGVKTLSQFVMPRKFGKIMMIMHSFGTGTHSDQAVSVASKTFTSGLSGIWYQWMWLFATPFYWLMAPMMRRFRALTTADVFEARFDRSVSVLYVLVGLVKYMIGIGMMLKGTGVIIEATTGGELPENLMIVVMTAMFLIYGLAGGLSSAIVTDFVQSILTILFSFILLPLVLKAVGGISGMRESLPEITGRDDMLSLVAPGEIGVFFILIIAINSLLGVVIQPHNMGTTSAGKTEIEGAVGFMGGNMIKRICTVAWCLTGLAALVYYKGEIEHPDQVYGMMAREFLPIGMLGVFIAALLATVMGSCDSFMIASSGLFTRNIYQLWQPEKSQAHYLWVARASALIVVAGGVFLAYTAEGIIKMLEQMWKVDAMMAMAFWLGIFWRRTTVVGAWSATLGALLVWAISSQAWFAGWLGGFSWAINGGVVREIVTDGVPVHEIWLPWQMLAYISAGFAVGIIASLFSTSVAPQKLEAFYNLLRTPIQPGEVIDKPCQLPDGMKPGARNVFFPSTQFEIPRPTWLAMSGFIIAWLIVVGIIGSVWLWVADK
ncbi:MAG: sodium:solute symporter family protein [Verrucomicrobia bacterium]|nr:sodium:solute symporter family protein [Verrucomicrobiota bacterium]